MRWLIVLALVAPTLAGCCLKRHGDDTGLQPNITVISKDDQIMTLLRTQHVKAVRVERRNKPSQDYTAKLGTFSETHEAQGEVANKEIPIPEGKKAKPTENQALMAAFTINSGWAWLNGTMPVALTERVRAVAVGTKVIVQTDDPVFHRVYFLEGTAVLVTSLITGEEQNDMQLGEFVEIDAAGAISKPMVIAEHPEQAEFVDRVLEAVGG